MIYEELEIMIKVRFTKTKISCSDIHICKYFCPMFLGLDGLRVELLVLQVIKEQSGGMNSSGGSSSSSYGGGNGGGSDSHHPPAQVQVSCRIAGMAVESCIMIG